MAIISIIVPVHNAEKYLHDCISSILSQTFKDFELILINDGSNDKSGAICDEFAKKDSRIKVIHKTFGGASTARNCGLEATIGKYIGWIDADDYISPDMYTILYNLVKGYNADIAECQYYMINGNHVTRSGEEGPIVSGSGDFMLKQFFSAQMKPSLVTKLYKREILEGIRFPVGRKHQDCYVNMSIALTSKTYVRIQTPLYYYIVRENSITTTLTSHEIRQAVYLYEFTLQLAENFPPTSLARKLLKNDAINRLICRYFEVSANSKLKNQYVYSYYLRKTLGFSLVKYLLFTNLPPKTKISYALMLLNLKRLQLFLHKIVGKMIIG